MQERLATGSCLHMPRGPENVSDPGPLLAVQEGYDLSDSEAIIRPFVPPAVLKNHCW